ncbi:MAG: histidinol dehydrogenase, partial [Deltaproteobacteria bacterium]
MSVICPPFTLPVDRSSLTQRLAPRRAPLAFEELQRILQLFERVFERGDAAVLSATAHYDQVALSRLAVSMDEVAEQVGRLPSELRRSVDLASRHIREVNLGLLPVDTEREVRAGTRVGERYRPLASVAVYVPTRKGPLISTAL